MAKKQNKTMNAHLIKVICSRIAVLIRTLSERIKLKLGLELSLKCVGNVFNDWGDLTEDMSHNTYKHLQCLSVSLFM